MRDAWSEESSSRNADVMIGWDGTSIERFVDFHAADDPDGLQAQKHSPASLAARETLLWTLSWPRKPPSHCGTRPALTRSTASDITLDAALISLTPPFSLSAARHVALRRTAHERSQSLPGPLKPRSLLLSTQGGPRARPGCLVHLQVRPVIPDVHTDAHNAAAPRTSLRTASISDKAT